MNSFALTLTLFFALCYDAIGEDSGECRRFDYEYKVIESLFELRRNYTVLLDTVAEQSTHINTLTSELQGLRQTIGMIQLGGGSSTYVRWGKTTCTGNGTELVYEGYAGGSHYTHAGAAVNYLCLPRDPDWGHYDDNLQLGGFVYGAEYEFNQRGPSSNFFGQTSGLSNNEAPCAVCRSTRSSVLMVPGKNQCHAGWTLEYHGYLSTGEYTHAAGSEYVCVDIHLDLLRETSTTNDYAKVFYFVEGRCGSLKCPPYVHGRELTCAVCTK